MLRKKKKKYGLLLIVLLFIVIAGLLCLIKWKSSQDVSVGEYSKKHVMLSEVWLELSADSFPAVDWEELFAEDNEYLTRKSLKKILEHLGVSEYIEVPGKGNRHIISREEWVLTYEQIVDYLDMSHEISEDTFLVLQTMKAENQNVITTNKGDYYTTLPDTYFVPWCAYRIYVKEGAWCIGILEISEKEECISNAYLKRISEETAVFLYSGAEYEKKIEDFDGGINSGVCDLIFQNGTLTVIREKKDAIFGDLLSYDQEFIEIEEYGKVAHDGKIPVYQTYGEVAEKSISDVVLGNMELEYITGEEKVCAILLKEPADIRDIRVLLLAEDGSKFRNEVYLKCAAPVTVVCGENSMAVEADTLIAAADYIGEDAKHTLICQTETGEGQFFLCDKEGNAVSNGYSGKIEIRTCEDGYTIVNVLPFETYLCSVVPSEMPSSYEPEALKAQAVCARSYAYKQLVEAKLAAYGAHIDDSTSYQVYNKVARTEATTKAVEDTAGKVLTYQDSIIEAYYFSTSMGYTGTAEVWNVQEPEDYGYLKQACLNEEAYEGNLSNETDFAAYIKNTAAGYDSDIKFYRWYAVAKLTDKTAAVNEILSARRQVSEENVMISEADGKTEPDSLAGFGELQSISVKERSTSGAILTLQLCYQNGTVLVKTEYNIRKVLGALVESIVYADSSDQTGAMMLPSAYCTVEMQSDGSILMNGGGYGHGIGMSQNGANGMAKAGMNYEDILNYFYQDIKIQDISEIY